MKNLLVKRRFFVVIHTVSSDLLGLDHAIGQTEVAKDNGADGVFIIPDYAKGQESKATTQDQFMYLENLKEMFPGFLIGANFLMNFSVIRKDIYAIKPDLLQTDSASLVGLEKEKLPTTEFFCGVAFKYSRYENIIGNELREHCVRVADVCDVPTTSGRATGVSADIKKIEEIMSYLPHGKRLGIASGVTQENVGLYIKGGVTDFLVATSLISHVDDFCRDILNSEKVSSLAATIHTA